MAKAKTKKINHEEMLAKIRAYKSLQSSKAAIEAELEQYKNDIIGVMTAHDLDEYEVDVFKVTYKDVSRSAIDSKRLKAERPDLYDKYLTESVSKRFSIA
ncbi:MAG: hypothetical protein ACI4K7_12555 [Oscillospiraceae bacterium]